MNVNGHANEAPNLEITTEIMRTEEQSSTARCGLIKSVFNLIHTLYTVLYLSTIAFIRSFLPSGVLPQKSVKDQIVLITGAGSGIGQKLAQRFSTLGARLVLWDINQKANEATSKICLANGAADVHTYTVDLSKKSDIQKTAEKVKDKVGPVDILINNAGVVCGKKLTECTDEQIEKTMNVNALAHIWAVKSFLPSMQQRNQGHIVSIASMAGLIGLDAITDYCASKFAAVGFNESLGVELYANNFNGIKTTTICPIYVDTGMFDGAKMSSFLLSTLSTDYAVNRTMEAILTESSILMLPKFAYFMCFCKGFLPVSAMQVIADYLGATHSMKEFKGRQVEKRGLMGFMRTPEKQKRDSTPENAAKNEKQQ